jgi:UDP-N-acetylmuramyl pentapeptide phosphotransferase/UDP-N-acetylglucosamine-1-phosphate transferase
MGEYDVDAPESEPASEVARKAPLKRFRLGRYALMLLFAFMAVAFFTPAVTSLVIAIDASGQSEVNLKRMTEGGSPVAGPMVAYETFLLIVIVSVGIFALAVAAAYLFLGDRVRPTAWAVITVVAVVGVAGALAALALETSEVGMYLASVAVCFAAVAAAGLFELWRARWVRRQPVSPAYGEPGSSSAEPRPT